MAKGFSYFFGQKKDHILSKNLMGLFSLKNFENVVLRFSLNEYHPKTTIQKLKKKEIMLIKKQ
jgi:hypothetical protein